MPGGSRVVGLLGDYDIRTLDMHCRGLTSRREAEEFHALRPVDPNGNSTAIEKCESAEGVPV